MEAQELLKHVKFTDMKSLPDQPEKCMLAVLSFKAKTKGGRWLDGLHLASSILITPAEELQERLIEEKKEYAINSLLAMLTSQTGVVTNRGWFILTDFEPLYLEEQD